MRKKLRDMSAQPSSGWARTPIHAAGGRRNYNSVRRFRAELRRAEIRSVLAESGMSLLVRGTQRVLAERFGVSESTISRDLVGIYGAGGWGSRCPFCSARPLDDDGVLAIEEAHDRLRACFDPHEDQDMRDDEL